MKFLVIFFIFQDIIIKKMAEKADRVSSNSTFDALLQKHYKEVVNLFEGMQRAVARQEQTISEKLDSKQLLKERFPKSLSNNIITLINNLAKQEGYYWVWIVLIETVYMLGPETAEGLEYWQCFDCLFWQFAWYKTEIVLQVSWA